MDSCVVSYSKLASSEAGAVANQAEKSNKYSSLDPIIMYLLLCVCVFVYTCVHISSCVVFNSYYMYMYYETIRT